ncbi:MAG TPA: transporter [Bryobacteraceae bacterium]|nr:transporter [Bryobacteraceae bacterium]
MRFSRNPKRVYGTAAILLAVIPITVAHATESGVSVYPNGVETVMPGAMPGPGGSLLEQFNNFYQANGLVDGNGHNLVPGFHLRVAAVAAKFVHNWGVHVFGGTLVSTAAAPFLYEHLNAPFGEYDKSGLGNSDIETLVAYGKGPWHWWYGVDGYLPGPQYNKNDILNIGQHNFATAPAGAISYLPKHGQTEISSRFQYIVNFTNPANQYRSGHEFIWEYAAMRNVVGKLAVGVNGDYYKQTTDDFQNGVIFRDGNRGRTLGIGPQIRYHLGHAALILKYQREMLVENRAVGNSFWFQFGMPVGRHE